MKKLLSIFPILFIVGACEKSSSEQFPETIKNEKNLNFDQPEVEVIRATRNILVLKKLVNGKIKAFDRVEIKFEATGRITHAELQNGQRVTKGSVLAKLDDTDLQYELAHKRIDLEVAENDRKERMMLVSGGDFGDSTITEQQRRYIDIVSGYNRARQAIEGTQHQLSKTTVLSPFDGLVGDLQVKRDQYVSTGETLCSLVNPGSYEATFAVTEALALELWKGQPVSVRPLARKGLVVKAKISAINPRVDEHGLVTAYARVQNNHHIFFEGMNIEVAVENPSPPVIVVPRDALVLRSGREVVFTYNPDDGRAKWNYVTVAHENDEMLGVSDGLKEGDLVIIKGQSVLDHDAEVILGNDGKE